MDLLPPTSALLRWQVSKLLQRQAGASMRQQPVASTKLEDGGNSALGLKPGYVEYGAHHYSWGCAARWTARQHQRSLNPNNAAWTGVCGCGVCTRSRAGPVHWAVVEHTLLPALLAGTGCDFTSSSQWRRVTSQTWRA